MIQKSCKIVSVVSNTATDEDGVEASCMVALEEILGDGDWCFVIRTNEIRSSYEVGEQYTITIEKE
jgi:hypothetical protein